VSEPREVAAGLLESAREDAAAALLTADAEVPDRIVGFHAQQAVEMFLKAVLALRGVAYERTHDIERLTSLVSNSGLAPPAEIDDLAQLTPWAVERRYGDPFDPEPLDRDWAVELVGTTEDWAGRAFAAPGG
jgi:HEPN domain-containing protein